MTELPANEGNETPLSREDNLAILATALATVKRITGELGVSTGGEDLADFSDHGTVPDVGEMHTASDSPEVHQARESLKAAFTEIGAIETAATVVEIVAEKFGLKIGA